MLFVCTTSEETCLKWSHDIRGDLHDVRARTTTTTAAHSGAGLRSNKTCKGRDNT